MKPKEQRYLELYEQVKRLVEVTETESRLAKLFPQSKFQIGNRDAQEIAKMKTKNVGKNGRYHSVVKMKKSSVVGRTDANQEVGMEEQPPIESPLNNGMQSPEESIRGMQDPMKVVQDLLSQGLSPDEVAQQLQQQGMSDEEISQIMQQLQQ